MSLRNRILALLFTAAVALLSGCATPTQRHAAGFDPGRLRTVVILPVDAEVSELSAGGTTEKRDDWTAQVVEHLTAILREQYRYAPATKEPGEVAAELTRTTEDLAPLFRAITFNQVLHTYYPGLPKVAATQGPLTYKTGSIAALLEQQKADAVLLVYLRDDYATAGRKGLTVLGVIAGIPIRSGFTTASAALVSADGNVLWMNIHGAKSGDLRTREGAEALVAKLLAGAPKIGETAGNP